MLSAITAGAQLSQPQAQTGSGISSQQILAAAMGMQMNNLGMSTISRNLNQPPTIEIRPGYVFNVMINKDMILPPWQSGAVAIRGGRMMHPASVNVPRSKAPIWGFICLCVVVVLINAGFTQFFADRLDYQSALGEPLLGHWYAPFAWVGWSTESYENNKTTWNIAYVTSLILYAFAFLVYALAIGFGSRRTKKYDWIHGTAHWATEDEIRKTGLLPSNGEHGRGVYVGAWEDQDSVLRYLRHDGPEHIAAIAPTRSGKGVGLVIPTLLSWPQSAVIHDMKGELWSLTAGWRQKEAKNKVLNLIPLQNQAVAGSIPCRRSTG